MTELTFEDFKAIAPKLIDAEKLHLYLKWRAKKEEGISDFSAGVIMGLLICNGKIARMRTPKSKKK